MDTRDIRKNSECISTFSPKVGPYEDLDMLDEFSQPYTLISAHQSKKDETTTVNS